MHRPLSLRITHDRATFRAIFQPRAWWYNLRKRPLATISKRFRCLAKPPGGFKVVKGRLSWVVNLQRGGGSGYVGGWTASIGWRAKRLGSHKGWLAARGTYRATFGWLTIQWTRSGNERLVPHGSGCWKTRKIGSVLVIGKKAR